MALDLCLDLLDLSWTSPWPPVTSQCCTSGLTYPLSLSADLDLIIFIFLFTYSNLPRILSARLCDGRNGPVWKQNIYQSCKEIFFFKHQFWRETIRKDIQLTLAVTSLQIRTWFNTQATTHLILHLSLHVSLSYLSVLEICKMKLFSMLYLLIVSTREGQTGYSKTINFPVCMSLIKRANTDRCTNGCDGHTLTHLWSFKRKSSMIGNVSLCFVMVRIHSLMLGMSVTIRKGQIWRTHINQSCYLLKLLRIMYFGLLLKIGLINL